MIKIKLCKKPLNRPSGVHALIYHVRDNKNVPRSDIVLITSKYYLNKYI